MSIGSLASAMILVSLLACTDSDQNSTALDANQQDLACGDFCKNEQFELFTGSKIHLEIEATGKPSQLFYALDPSDLTAGLVLRDTIQLSGQAHDALAYIKQDLLAENRDRQVRYSDIIAIPTANKISFLSPSIPAVKSQLFHDASYNIDLFSGLSYSVILNPNGVYHRAPVFLATLGLTKNTQLNFTGTKAIKVSGQVSSQDTLISASLVPPSLKASIVQGHRLVSSVEDVDINGHFTLELASSLFTSINEVPLMLKVEPNNPENALPLIKQKLPTKPINEDIDIGIIDFGRLKPPLEVSIEVHGSDNTIIANAFIFMSAKIGQGNALVKKQVNSSGTTVFSQIYEGVYDIAIVPPFDSKFALKVIKNVSFGTATAPLLSFALQKRELLNALVLDPSGNAVNGAQIELSRIGKIGDFATEDIFEDMLFKLTATTNDNGRLCQRRFGFNTSDQQECRPLSLDEGRYLAHVHPPAGSKLAHHWLTFDFPTESTLEIKLKHPKLLIGKILSPDRQSPIRQAFVTIYLADSKLYHQAQVIGNAISDDHGVFRAFVSAN